MNAPATARFDNDSKPALSRASMVPCFFKPETKPRQYHGFPAALRRRRKPETGAAKVDEKPQKALD
jgi:hypothetical protein